MQNGDEAPPPMQNGDGVSAERPISSQSAERVMGTEENDAVGLKRGRQSSTSSDDGKRAKMFGDEKEKVGDDAGLLDNLNDDESTLTGEVPDAEKVDSDMESIVAEDEERNGEVMDEDRNGADKSGLLNEDWWNANKQLDANSINLIDVDGMLASSSSLPPG